MNAKKTVSSFISPNWIPVVVCLLIPGINFFALLIFLCGTLPTLLRANKTIKKLEANGQLENAAAEIFSADSKRLVKGKVILTNNFVFCKSTGYAFTYDEIAWAYKHRLTNTFLFIPIKVTDSLYIATKATNPRQVAAMGKDKTEEIKNAIVEIYNHNNNCLIGYTNETIAQYNNLKKG